MTSGGRTSIAVVDTGPLVALTNRRDPSHDECLAVFTRRDLRFVIPAMVVAEASYLIARHMGARTDAAFLAGMSRFDVRAPLAEDWSRIAELALAYANFPLGGTDASLIALAERLDTDLVITLDQRHFRAVRPAHRSAFRILP